MIDVLNQELAEADRELAAAAKADPIRATADDGAWRRLLDLGPVRGRARRDQPLQRGACRRILSGSGSGRRLECRAAPAHQYHEGGPAGAAVVSRAGCLGGAASSPCR